MMTKTYNIDGMTCGGCVASVKKQLESSNDISDASIQLAAPQARLTFRKELDI